MKVKDLKRVIKAYRKEAMIQNYGKLKKKQLIELLKSKFELKDGKLFLKQSVPSEQSKPKKKRIAPTLVTEPKKPAQQDNSGLTQGQKTFNKSIQKIERRARLPGQISFAKKIRGIN